VEVLTSQQCPFMEPFDNSHAFVPLHLTSFPAGLVTKWYIQYTKYKTQMVYNYS